MKRYLVLLLLEDVNSDWNEDDVARYVGRDEEDDSAIAVKKIPHGQWKFVKRRIESATKNKGKEIWNILGLK